MSPGLITPTCSIFIGPFASFAAPAEGRPPMVRVAAAPPAVWRNPRRLCFGVSVGSMEILDTCRSIEIWKWGTLSQGVDNIHPVVTESSARGVAAVDDQLGTGHERGLVGSQKDDAGGDVFGRSQAAERVELDEVRALACHVGAVLLGAAFHHGGDQRRLDVARMDRVDAYLVTARGAFERHGFGEEAHRALARAVGGGSLAADEAEDRGNHDDGAEMLARRALGLHRGDGRPRAEVDAVDVHPHERAPILRRRVGERPLAGYARVVDQHVEEPERLAGGVDDGGPLGLLAHVGGKRDRIAAAGARHAPVASAMGAATTRAPSRASATAPARPIPDPAPVTIATLPSTLPIVSFPETNSTSFSGARNKH